VLEPQAAEAEPRIRYWQPQPEAKFSSEAKPTEFHGQHLYSRTLPTSSFTFESRDEILFKGGRLWRPRLLISIINANDRISWVQPADIGQTMVNLGHHLENLADKP
jgi:hypothetical protein